MGIDPGLTVGWARAEGQRIVGWGQVDDHMVWELLSQLKPERIQLEKFVYRGRIKVDFAPVEVIGIVKEWGRQNGVIVDNSMQLSQVGHFFTNDRLKERGLYQSSMPHAMDAIRHLSYRLDFGGKK